MFYKNKLFYYNHLNSSEFLKVSKYDMSSLTIETSGCPWVQTERSPITIPISGKYPTKKTRPLYILYNTYVNISYFIYKLYFIIVNYKK